MIGSTGKEVFVTDGVPVNKCIPIWFNSIALALGTILYARRKKRYREIFRDLTLAVFCVTFGRVKCFFLKAFSPRTEWTFNILALAIFRMK